ncbi:DUF1934 domain-containing protein [Anaerolentibacter hominis]|uniref:DUF1934 domain-containing protein n=1 Tax=Anaerolentibacter hominis TaxID=3079009 RepID=UPI0031B85834
MTKDVIVSVTGMQFEADSEEPIQSISAGTYENREGRHIITYDEIMLDDEGNQYPHKNTMVIGENYLELNKEGEINTHLIFQEKQKSETFYQTPFGDLLMGMDTTFIQVEEAENRIGVRVEYSLSMNHGFVSDCTIDIEIRAKG